MPRWSSLLVLFVIGLSVTEITFAQKKKESPLVPENLALGKKATASTEQDEGRNAAKGIDGDLDTRWSPSSGAARQWYQVDLGKPEDLTGCRITWEFDGPGYGYRVEGSPDGRNWTLLVDQHSAKLEAQAQQHKFSAKKIRYVKLTTSKLPPGKWASFYELEIFGTKLVPAPVAKGNRPATSAAGIKDLKVLPDFEATLFAGPPEVNYPTCLAATPTGEVFVGIDPNGSLDAKPGRGKIVLLKDTKGTGTADQIKVFAKIDSPRGLCFDGKTLYVLHPPYLTALHDDDGDGVADRSEVLVKGIGRDLKFRGADHTTNGIRMGIDGWIYVAVGDYGFMKAVGKDGRELQFRGGGGVRVRPDGTGLEVVSRGQRNIYDVAIDPLMNIFTRDNTNDGDGWDVRLSQVVQLGNYGYPTLFTHFGAEIIQPILDTGGGAPTGALFLSEPGFPGDFGQSLLTCEWGRSAIHRHPLTPQGSTFKTKETPFITMARPTDLDVDGMGHIYVSSWRNGGFTYSGPNVGYVARVTPKNYHAEPFPKLAQAGAAELIRNMASASHVRRFFTQQEILRRGPKPELVAGLTKLAQGREAVPVRVAALYTYTQLLGVKSRDLLVKLADDAVMREFALKALVDRQPDSAPLNLFLRSLSDPDPRVRLQAVIGVARIGQKSSAGSLVPLLADTDPVVAHITVQALIAMKAVEPCLSALNQDHAKVTQGALRVLQSLHESRVVDGLLTQSSQSNGQQNSIFRTLCRLYFKEADWDGSWWGTRPDVTGPHFKPVAWSETPRIADYLKKVLAKANPDDLPAMVVELNRHRIDFPEAMTALLKLGSDPARQGTVVNVLAARKQIPPESIPFLAAIVTAPRQATPEDNLLRAKALKALYRGGAKQETAIAAALRGFALLQPGKEPAELTALYKDFVRDNSHAKRLLLFLKAVQAPEAGERELALTVLFNLSGSKIAGDRVKAAAQKAADLSMSDPKAALSFLHAISRTKSEDYGFQVLTLTKSSDPEVQKEAQALVKLLNLDRPRQDRKDAIKYLTYESVLAAAQKEKGDPTLGARLFAKQGCSACHTLSKTEPAKGPYLGDVATRYKRPELIESILKPSAKIAQGFETTIFVLTNGKTLTGFVSREGGDEVEVRDGAGLSVTLKKADIDERLHSKISVMPEQLVETLTVPELASILAYLESLTKTP